MTTVSAHEARQNLSQLIELAFYKNALIRIERNKKPMARIVGEPFMAALERLLEGNPALAETLSILLDDALMAAIEEGTQDVEKGNLIPIEDVLDE